MFLKSRIVLGVGNHVQFCICSFWLINCRVNFCLLTLAVLDLVTVVKNHVIYAESLRLFYNYSPNRCIGCETFIYPCANFCTNRLMDLLGFIDNWSVPDSMGRELVPWRCYRSRVVRLEDEFLLLV